MANPSFGARQGLEPALRLVGDARADGQDAVRAPSPAAHPPAQLVELGQPESLRAFDDDHRRLGNVDPDLDHGRRQQHLHVAPRRKRSVTASRSARAMRPCTTPSATPGSAAATSAARCSSAGSAGSSRPSIVG